MKEHREILGERHHILMLVKRGIERREVSRSRISRGRVEQGGRGSRSCKGAVGGRVVTGLTVEFELIRMGGIVERRGRFSV